MEASRGTLLSAEDLWDERFAGKHLELVDGVVRYMTPGNATHGATAAALLIELGFYLRTNPVGRLFIAETGFVLRRQPDTVRCPDVAFVAAERLASGIPTGFFEGAPDMAAEVVSPRNTRKDVAKKTAEYLDTGCRLLWVLEPKKRTVTVHEANGVVRKLASDHQLDGGAVLPGFRCQVAALFLPDA